MLFTPGVVNMTNNVRELIIAPTTNTIYGTGQFIEACRSKYKNFDCKDLNRIASIILQRQIFMIYQWSLIRYCIEDLKRISKIDKLFFNISPSNFEPESIEISLYLQNPKFLWRFSNCNYNYFVNCFKLNDLSLIQNYCNFKTFNIDDSLIVTFLNVNSKNKFDVPRFFQTRSIVILNDYSSIEYLYSDDFHLLMLEGNINYIAFVSYLLTGQFMGKYSKLLNIYIKSSHYQLKISLKESQRMKLEIDKRIRNEKDIKISKFKSKLKFRSRSRSTPRSTFDYNIESDIENFIESIDKENDIMNNKLYDSIPIPANASRYIGFKEYEDSELRLRNIRKIVENRIKDPLVKITHPLYINTDWVHKKLINEGTLASEFYKSLIEIYGDIYHLNNFRSINSKGEIIRVGWKVKVDNLVKKKIINEYIEQIKNKPKLIKINNIKEILTNSLNNDYNYNNCDKIDDNIKNVGYLFNFNALSEINIDGKSKDKGQMVKINTDDKIKESHQLQSQPPVLTKYCLKNVPFKIDKEQFMKRQSFLLRHMGDVLKHSARLEAENTKRAIRGDNNDDNDDNDDEYDEEDEKLKRITDKVNDMRYERLKAHYSFDVSFIDFIKDNKELSDKVSKYNLNFDQIIKDGINDKYDPSFILLYKITDDNIGFYYMNSNDFVEMFITYNGVGKWKNIHSIIMERVENHFNEYYNKYKNKFNYYIMEHSFNGKGNIFDMILSGKYNSVSGVIPFQLMKFEDTLEFKIEIAKYLGAFTLRHNPERIIHNIDKWIEGRIKIQQESFNHAYFVYVIAKDRHMSEIYQMIRIGTQIDLMTCQPNYKFTTMSRYAYDMTQYKMIEEIDNRMVFECISDNIDVYCKLIQSKEVTLADMIIARRGYDNKDDNDNNKENQLSAEQELDLKRREIDHLVRKSNGIRSRRQRKRL